MRRNLILAVVAVAVGLGVWLWWQQGGFGGPVSDAAARRYFDRIVAVAQAKDFQALCRLNGTVGTCRGTACLLPRGLRLGPGAFVPPGSSAGRVLPAVRPARSPH